MVLLGSLFCFVFRECFGRVFLGSFSAFGCLWEVVLEAFWALFGDFFVIRGKSENGALARAPARSRGSGRVQKSMIFDVFSGLDSRCVFIVVF